MLDVFIPDLTNTCYRYVREEEGGGCGNKPALNVLNFAKIVSDKEEERI